LTLWEGRISTGMADAVAAFTISLPFDKALAPTIWPARAPRQGPRQGGILSDSEVTTLVETLDIVEKSSPPASSSSSRRRGHPHRH